MNSSANCMRRSEFDDFLFASIGEEQNGMPLSVLSAFARHDVDPWLVAGELARMPTDAAIERIALLIWALPQTPSTQSRAEAVAATLVKLLPHRSPSSRPPGKAKLAIAAGRDYRLLVFLIIMSFLLSAQYLTRGARLPAQNNGADGPTSSRLSMPGDAK
jgi:hypothetical protein